MADDNESLDVTIAMLLRSDDAVHGVALDAGSKENGVSLEVEVEPEDNGLASESADHRYVIGNILARGGMGAVMIARDVNIRRKVAMKVMLDRTRVAKSEIVRFIEEAQVTGQLEHPNIVPVHELGVGADGNPFYAMKMIKGVTLKKIIEDIRDGNQSVIAAYPLTKLLGIYLQACNGVAYAHSKGVVHRDLKPENIMVGEYGEVLVVDWGLAKIIEKGKTYLIADTSSDELPAWVEEDIDSIRSEDDSQKTIQGVAMGTPAFMAPEQAKDASSVDHRADVYAMGGVLYNILTLRPPVSGSTLVVVLMKVLRGEIEHPSVYSRESKSAINVKVLNPTKAQDAIVLSHLNGAAIPQSLCAVAMKALATRVEDRYQSVLELQTDIQKYLDGFATGAEQAGFGTQLRLLVMRHKTTVASLAVGLILLATVITVSFVRLNHERARTQLAKEQSDQNAKIAAENAEAAAASAAEAQKTLADLKSTVPVFLAQARNEIFNQNFADALNITSHALQLDSENADIYCLRGHILQTLLRLREAEVAYAKALSYRADYKDARENAAITKRMRLLHENRDKAPEADTFLIGELNTELFKQARMAESAYMTTKLAKLGQDMTPEWTRLFEKFTEKVPSQIVGIKDGAFSIGYIPGETTDINGIQILKGMPIASIGLICNISDLSPVKGLDIRYLYLDHCNVTDLSPLEGMPLDALTLYRTKVTDFSPLRNLHLKRLDIIGTPALTDISFMKDMPLENLSLVDWVKLDDLSPLAGKHLHSFSARGCSGFTDISALKGMPLEEVDLTDCRGLNADDLKVLFTLPRLERLRPPIHIRDIEFLKEIKTLTHMDYANNRWATTADDFWDEYDKKKLEQ